LGPIHFSVIAEARVVKFCTQVGYIKSWKWDNTLPKKTWLCSRDQFRF